MRFNATVSSAALLGILVLLLPGMVRAQNYDWLTTFIASLGALVGESVAVLVGLAVLVFVWGLVVFVWKSGDDKAHEEGRRKMLLGVVGLFLIVSVWGIVALLEEIVGVDSSSAFGAPGVIIENGSVPTPTPRPGGGNGGGGGGTGGNGGGVVGPPTPPALP